MITKVVPVGTTCYSKGQASPTPSSPVKGGVTTVVPDHEITETLTETLVYTVGVGSTAHETTTKVTSTTTSTVYKTIVATPSAGKPVYPEGEEEGTTTIHSTTTSTKVRFAI
jgi:hypothetical protein